MREVSLLGAPKACWMAGCLLATSLGCSTLHAQAEPHWAVPTTIGFGGLGCAAGYLLGSETVEVAEWGSARTPSVTLATIGGCLAGALLGERTGREADERLAAGEELPAGLRRGVQLGTVLTGATLGTLISFIPAGQSENHKNAIVATYALAGAAVGFVVQASLNHCLDSGRSISSLSLGRAPGGGLAFGLTFWS